MKEENIKKDSVLDILSSLTLIGDKVLIKLDSQLEDAVTEDGIYIPYTEMTESDGGRPVSKASEAFALTKGTVVSITPYANQKLSEYQISLQPNDKVYVNKAAMHYKFSINRSTLIDIDTFDGYVAVPHNLIEAKIKDGI